MRYLEDTGMGGMEPGSDGGPETDQSVIETQDAPAGGVDS
jgi:hypothetical protein